MQTEQYSAKQFARDVDANVRKYPSESEVLRHLKPLLAKLIRSPGSVPVGSIYSERRQVRDEPDTYAKGRDVLDNRRSLASGPDNSNPRPLNMGTDRCV